MATFFRLLSEHGSAAAALAALPEIARAAGVRDYVPFPLEAAEAEYDAGRRIGARLLPFGAAEYPAALAEIPDAPPLLWVLGDPSHLNRTGVALVGARNASSLGLRMARSLARGLGAQGLCVVSGLARGIDAEAHRAALASGTVAVHAGGVDVVYPDENRELADEIAATGVRVSEAPLGLEPQARHFPRRNRIVSGLSRAVVVVEAAARSGSLITARLALEQGRDVLAVPGHPFDARASGCNLLIRDGATLVRGPADVLAALGLGAEAGSPAGGADAARPARAPEAAGTSAADDGAAGPSPPAGAIAVAPGGAAIAILGLLGPSPVSEDQLIRDLGLAPQEVAAELLSLELDGRVARHPGGLLSLAT